VGLPRFGFSGGLVFEQAAVANSEVHRGGVNIRLLRAEDLPVMKAIAQRPKDLQNTAGLLAATVSLTSGAFGGGLANSQPQ
jgi:hypothetical protein